MRVLFITSSYPAHHDDPRGIHIHRIARGLCREGEQVTVITPGVPFAPSQEVLDGVEVHRTPYWFHRWQHLAAGLGGIEPNLQQRPWLLLQIPTLIAALSGRALRLAQAFDVIHAHWLYPAGVAGVIAAKLRRVPLVVTSHGGDLNLARHWRILRLLTRRISRAADACVAVSDALCEEFFALGVPSTSVACIPAGVELPNALPSSGGEGSATYQQFESFTGFRLVYVGSLIPRKSVETLLEAHHELERRSHRVASAIVGAGPCKDQLKSAVRERSLRNVFFVEGQSPSSVPRWMSAAQVLVLPSLSEGRPVVVMEAMALGLPTVATDIPGTRELVRDRETGFLFPTRDAKGLADHIEQLLMDERLRQEMGQRGRELIESEGLTTVHVARKHIILYERVCSLRRAPMREGP